LGALEETMKKKTTSLGALEKFRKKKTMALKVQPRRRRWLWEFWKKSRRTRPQLEVSAKKKKTIAMEFWKKLERKRPWLWELWKKL
jgi:hypothetical protein